MKKMKDENIKDRRNFLKVTIAGIATVGLASAGDIMHSKPERKKIKMLTADGKLVEVDEALISQASLGEEKVSNQELKNWMKTSKI